MSLTNRQQHNLSPAEQKRLKNAYLADEKVALSVIARRFHISEEKVKHYLKDMGVPIRRSKQNGDELR